MRIDVGIKGNYGCDLELSGNAQGEIRNRVQERLKTQSQELYLLLHAPVFCR
jgi:hypothetical protein